MVYAGRTRRGLRAREASPPPPPSARYAKGRTPMARDRAARTRRQFVQGSLIVAGLVMLGGCGRLPWQAQPKIPRVGYLTGGAQVMRDAFRLELEDLGYVEGHTVA